MKEHPILLNGEMVKAVLDGRKTMTRRVIKTQPYGFLNNWKSDNTPCVFVSTNNEPDKRICPYGQPGDRLWVREAWKTDIEYDPCSPSQIDSGASLYFLADECASRINRHKGCGPIRWGKTRPSIHMPRWASRITLEVVSVRVERVQEITEDDAMAEGIERYCSQEGKHYNPTPYYKAFPEKDGGLYSAKAAFEVLWDSINAERGFGWDVNPWVWVIEFKRLTATRRERVEGK